MKVSLPGGQSAEGTEIKIAKIDDLWTELTLADGVVIRIKTVISAIIQLKDRYDGEGNPVYVIRSTPAVTIFSVPDNLKKQT